MYPVQYLRTASLSGWIPDPARLGRLGEQGMFTLLLSMAIPFIRYPTQPSRSPTLLGFFLLQPRKIQRLRDALVVTARRSTLLALLMPHPSLTLLCYLTWFLFVLGQNGRKLQRNATQIVMQNEKSNSMPETHSHAYLCPLVLQHEFGRIQLLSGLFQRISRINLTNFIEFRHKSPAEASIIDVLQSKHMLTTGLLGFSSPICSQLYKLGRYFCSCFFSPHSSHFMLILQQLLPKNQATLEKFMLHNF